MPALHVRDVDDAVIARLKERARRHRRSLQGEVRFILETAVGRGRKPSGKDDHRLRLHTVAVGHPPSLSRDVIYRDDER